LFRPGSWTRNSAEWWLPPGGFAFRRGLGRSREAFRDKTSGFRLESHPRHQPEHDRLLDVQPVLGFVEDAALGAVADLGRDLLAAMGRQAVEEDRLLAGVG